MAQLAQDTDDVICAQDVETYSNGECWYLAWTIHRLTGWPCVLHLPGYVREDDDYSHVLVRTPRGLLLDITGEHTEAEIITEWTSRADGRLRQLEQDQTALLLSWTPLSDGDHLFAAHTEVIARYLIAQWS